MTTIHRLLDEAFAGIEPTPDAQDLKEEMRANLEARVAELEADGVSPDAAARRAIGELGDIRELLGELPDAPRRSPWDPPAGVRIRPKPAFVVRVTVAATVVAAALATFALGALGVIPLPLGATIGLLALGASAIGWTVGDALHQETTTNHPMPQARAGGFYAATSLVIFALGFGALIALGPAPLWTVVFPSIALVLGIALFAFLGATQTNRHKSWALRHSEQYTQQEDRFSQDPAAAARFGIYTLVIIVVAVVAFIVLGFTTGWAWAWLALVAGFLVMMIVLARMLFPPTH